MPSQSQGSFSLNYQFDGSQPIFQTLRSLMKALDARFEPLETDRADYDEVIDNLENIAQQRINYVLGQATPLLEKLQNFSSIFQATSGTSLPITMGPKVFIIPPAQAPNFVPSSYMSALASDLSSSVAGLVSGWNEETGALTINVIETYGTGINSTWIISPAVPPQLASASIDGGTIDPGGTPYNVVMPYVYAGPQPITTQLDGGEI